MSRAYLNRTGLQLSRYPGPVMVYRSHASSPITSDLRWAPARGAPASAVWPPPGLHLEVELGLESNEVQRPTVHQLTRQVCAGGPGGGAAGGGAALPAV